MCSTLSKINQSWNAGLGLSLSLSLSQLAVVKTFSLSRPKVEKLTLTLSLNPWPKPNGGFLSKHGLPFWEMGLISELVMVFAALGMGLINRVVLLMENLGQGWWVWFHVYRLWVLDLWTLYGWMGKSICLWKIFNLALCLFRWKTLCKDSFSCFLVFDSIRINELNKNYLYST